MHSGSHSFTFKNALTFLLVFALAFAPVSIQAKETLTIGLLPEMNVFDQTERFRPLADYLGRQTGMEVQLSMLSSYGNIIDRLRSNKIDAAFLGSLTAAIAITQLGVTPVARPVNPDNTSTYHGLLFSRKDKNISNLRDMRGKTMAFVERSTTAGYIFPLAWLNNQGVTDFTTFLKDYFFAGSHDAAIAAVLNGKADIGSAKNTIYHYYLETNPEARKELTIIAESVPVPSNSLCVTRAVSKRTVAKLQAALLGLDKTAEGAEVLRKLHARKFVKTDATDYKPVIDMAKKAGINLAAYYQ